MRTTKIFWLFGLTLPFILFSATPGSTGAEPKRETRAPVITHAFAVEKGYYGDVWKIYIEAEDPDGQMLRIASVVDEVGYGHYPTDWIYLKPEYQKHFKGYIQWNTFSEKARYLPEWTRISLKVSVFDKDGNESNEVVFPFTFEMTPKQYVDKPPAPFNQGDLPRLGYIMTDLVNPVREDRDRDRGIVP
ncbi:MAG: hypothetical protein ABSG44_11595 [Thermodesulfobacteriota bacterium]|jgi:hypothetical protein